MKVKHNKKRNTAFLYETLVRELTKSIISKNGVQKDKVFAIIKEYFDKTSVLGKELQLYRILLETTDIEDRIAEKILHEAKVAHSRLDSKRIFLSQSEVIKKINKEISKDAWGNFVPNFKTLATVSSIFNTSTPIKQRVLHEDRMIKNMSTHHESVKELEGVDNLVYKSFVEKFNESYGDLHENQKVLLSKYITSFADNGLELKTYLNEEVGRLKKEVTQSLSSPEIKSDPLMVEKTQKVLGMLEEFKTHKLDQKLISSVLRVQKLVRELNSND